MTTERQGPGRRREDEQCATHHEAITRIVTTMQVLGTVAALLGMLICYIYKQQVDEVKSLSIKLDRYGDSMYDLSVKVARIEGGMRQ